MSSDETLPFMDEGKPQTPAALGPGCLICGKPADDRIHSVTALAPGMHAYTVPNFKNKLALFVELDQRRRELDRNLKETTARLDALEEPLREEMSELGMANTRVNGLTVYIHRQLWASAAKREVTLPDGTTEMVGDNEAACDALIAAGHAEFVHPAFNTNTVSAWVRELPEDEETGMPILPPEVQGKLSVTARYSLRTRK